MKLKNSKATIWIQENTRASKQKWEKLKHKNLVTIALISVVVFFVGLFGYLFIVPFASRTYVIKSIELRNGSKILSKWKNLIKPMLTKVYLWNLTNAEDVSMGLASPIFKEIGPYIYEQYIEKIPIEFKENSIVYNSRSNFKLREDLTAPASVDDTVVTIQAALYGAAVFVEAISPSMVSLIDTAVPYLFPGLDSIFISARVGSYLFDGLTLNCSNGEGTTAEMICNALPNYAPPNLQKKENSPDFSYSFLSYKNNTLQGPYEEDRGLQDIKLVGNIISLNNKSEMEIWNEGTNCDLLRGTDTLSFAPFVEKTDIPYIYISIVCHVSPLYFEKEDYLHGLKVYKFTLTDRWLESGNSYPDNKCYCMENKEEFCDKSGIRDISGCMKAPVVMSLPHFYGAGEEFRTYAQGMSPDKDSHTSFLYLEPNTGSPLKGAKRAQFNMNLRRIEGFNLVANVSEGLFPLMWIEEGVMIPEEMLGPIKTPMFVQRVANIVCLVLMAAAVIAICCSLIAFLFLNRLCCFNRMSNNKVTALFYKSSPESNQVKSNVFPPGVGEADLVLTNTLYPYNKNNQSRASQ